MHYENPQPKEGINTSEEHPLKELAQLLIGIALVVVIAVLILSFIAGSLVRFIPFSYEQKMVSGFSFVDVEHSQQQAFFHKLADKVSLAMELPEEMSITVHYDNSDMVNAFATLGGNLYFFQGLLDTIESEDELAAVMGHEIAHVKFRHPIVALGKGVTVASLAASVSGFSGSSAGEWLIGSAANLSLLKFSRDQESAADAASAAVLAKLYGHIGGANELFKHFALLESGELEINVTEKSDSGVAETKSQDKTSTAVELFRSHPYSENRWLELAELAENRNWYKGGDLTKLAIPSE
jgi:Zn-dependent protease with chaperone function